MNEHANHPVLHSFPTRRSSDLERRRHCHARRWAILRDGARRDVDMEVGAAQCLLVNAELIGVGLGIRERGPGRLLQDRKSTRLNSSHMSISYAVFCLKKKNQME